MYKQGLFTSIGFALKWSPLDRYEIFVYRRESILKLSIICEQLVLVMEQQENVTLLQNVHPEGGLVAALVVMVLESVAILFRYEERSC